MLINDNLSDFFLAVKIQFDILTHNLDKFISKLHVFCNFRKASEFKN